MLRVTGLCAGNSPGNYPHKWPVTRKIFHFMTPSCNATQVMALICITAWISKCVINSSWIQGAIWPSLSPWTVTNPILLTSSWNPVRAYISNYLHIKLCNIIVPHWNLNTQCGLADQLKLGHGPLARKVKLRAAHAPEMPGTFPRHRELTIPTCIMARAWRMPG